MISYESVIQLIQNNKHSITFGTYDNLQLIIIIYQM